MKNILAIMLAVSLTLAGIMFVLMLFEQPWKKKK